MKIKSIFQNEELQKDFEKNGFVKIQLLEKPEVEKLLSFYASQDFDNKIEAGFHISLDNQNENLVSQVSEKIVEIIEPFSKAYFKESKIFTASYVVKEAGKQNIVPPHQDWTFVDETTYTSATVWTPLVDVSEKNGALAIVRGSHRLFNHIRSSPSPQSKSPLSDYVFTLFPFTEVIPMKAGEALVFDNRLIHASPPNLTENPRVAVGIGITQQESQLKHYYQNPKENNQLEEYEVDASFFNVYNNKRLSRLFDEGKLLANVKHIRSIKREVPELTKEKMEELVLNLEGVKYNGPFMDRLATLFNYKPDGSKSEIKEEQKRTDMEEVKEKKKNEEWKDPRGFFEMYSPKNIIKEIIWRLKGRPKMDK